MPKKGFIDVEEALRGVIRKDDRYPIKAYLFVREALDYTISRRKKRGHVRGQELLEGLRDYAILQFGPLTLSVFRSWNVRRTEDFGEIVFNMVEIGILGKTDEDSKADFEEGFDFEEAFGRQTLLDKDFKL